MKTLLLGLVGWALVGCGSDSIDAIPDPEGGAGTSATVTTTAKATVEPTSAAPVGSAGTSGLGATTTVEAAGSTAAAVAGAAGTPAAVVAVGGGTGTTTDRSVVAGAAGTQAATGGSYTGPSTNIGALGGSAAVTEPTSVGTGGSTVAGPGRASGGTAALPPSNGRAGNPNIVVVGTTPSLDLGAGGSDTTPRIQCCWYSSATGRVETGTLTEAQCRAVPNPWPCGLRV